MTLLRSSRSLLTALIHLNYVAGFTPEQEAGFREAAGMQRPGQFFDATQLSGVAGMGGIESARSAAGYGALGTEYGMEAAGLGGLYERMATSPDALKAYMSPYHTKCD
jgi:hypothetical protein